jgi:hypothetical protein
MENVLLKVIIPGKNLGLLQQAIHKVLTSIGITKITIVVENILYTEDCTVYFVQRHGSIILPSDEQTVFTLLGDVMTHYGALVAEENKKPFFRFFAHISLLYKISEKVASCHYLAQIDMTNPSYGWISFYKKEKTDEEEAIKDISFSIKNVIADLTTQK